MDAGDSWRLGLLLVCLALSAFFSASETAFVALPRARLLHLVRIGRSGAARVERLVQHPERFLATVLLSNNLVNTAAAALATALALKFLDGNATLAVLASTVGVTLLLLLFCETLPKSIAWNRAETVSFGVARPLSVISLAAAPVTRLLQLFSNLAHRLLGISAAPYNIGEEEIRSLIAAGAQSGAVEAEEADLLEKVFHFGDRQMREVMTPRPEIIWVEEGLTLGGFLPVYNNKSHTRFPVYQGTMENVVGILSVKDVLTGLSAGPVALDESVTGQLRPAFFVPETRSVRATFQEMREKGHSVALTVDEFGGIAGLATLKQLLEVIVGQVGEEGAAPEKTVTVLGTGSYQVDAGLSVAAVKEELSIALPEGDYQTLAGFILERLGRIPAVGDTLEYDGMRLTVTKMDRARIEQVELERRHIPAAEDAS